LVKFGIFATLLNEYYFPEHLQPDELDAFLNLGWFRMGQALFTANHICFNGIMYNTVWLRHDLKNYQGGTTFAKLKKRNQHFTVKLSKAQYTQEQNNLYLNYLQSVPFAGCSSIDELLFGFTRWPNSNVFNTHQLCIYDGDILIGCTYFDVGTKTAQGISSFYDPMYKNYSIGKYLIYLQIEVCKANDFDYFYPGYFVPGYPAFDYKLTIAQEHLHYYHHKNDQWLPINQFIDDAIGLEMFDELYNY
jgi:leucyl-tRNA---protein transferase